MQFCHNPRFAAQNGKWPTRLKKAQAYELDWRRDSTQEILFLSLTKACDEKRIYLPADCRAKKVSPIARSRST